MPKPRSKRQAIRDERKQKRNDQTDANDDNSSSKRRRLNNDDENPNGDYNNANNIPVVEHDYGASAAAAAAGQQFEKEFFGMLSEDEQEYFRGVDEMLETDDFESAEERRSYLNGVFAEARDKALKLACSQSCSRLMERLILMSNTRQKKMLFGAFAGHFLNLIQHRFASHCCETLFLQSAPIVTQELSGERDDMPAEGDDVPDDEKTLPYMEELFLLTLDELEGQLGFLLTDRFASHTIRVFLIILSGRPLEQSATKSLIHSKKKEKIATGWGTREADQLETQLRAVPSSFTLATSKIISDVVTGMSPTELRVLATHPTGNPVLQLMLELDISHNTKSAVANEKSEDGDGMMLLWQLLPGGPSALKEPTSPACEFINSMLYDPIGSRLLETLVTNAPGRLFKAMYKQLFKERIHSFLRNDIASYPAIRVLNRLSKEDLVAAVQQTVPDVPKLVSLSRFNVIKALFERCHARQASAEVKALTQALIQAYGGDKKSLVPKLCQLEDIPSKTSGDAAKADGEETSEKPKSKKNGDHDPLAKNKAALVSHGSQLATTMLAMTGPASDAVQTSISSLSADQLYHLSTSSAPSCYVVTTALKTPSANKAFHKALVSSLRPYVADMVLNSEHGDRVISAVIEMPTTQTLARPVPGAAAAASAAGGPTTISASLPLHLKESVMNVLGEHEKDLRETYQGRRIWRNVKGELWAHRRADWVSWQKEIAPITITIGGGGGGKRGPTGSNGVAVGEDGGGGEVSKKMVSRGKALPSQSSSFAATGSGGGGRRGGFADTKRKR